MNDDCFSDLCSLGIASEREVRRRKKVKQWVKDAVAYWRTRVYEGDIGVDWDAADIRCWRCGCLRSCQRCHIVPSSLGGSDDTSNIIPLCAECHDEMPNVASPAVVWEWIKKDHAALYDIFWAERAQKAAGLTPAELRCFSIRKFKNAYKQCGVHLGQLSGRARTTTQTLAWALQEACRR
jgi:5-methylcytosine-specific restriction endonuclease McrA